jgi:hypothetical protein
MSDEHGSPIHYTAVERGTPVLSSDGLQVGEVRRVEDNYAEHILDGFEFIDTEGALRFVDAPEVARTFERAVTLSITATEVPERTKLINRGMPGLGGAGGGLIGRLFGR